MSAFAIRAARPDEWAAIRDLTLAAYAQYAPVLAPASWDAYRQDMIRAIMDPDAPVTRLVAEADGRLVGSVLLYPPAAPAGLPEVRLLAVLPGARGQGLGRALMEECLRQARRAGATALSLHTADTMPVAMHLYERMGFERTPETDAHPAPGIFIKGYRRSLADVEVDGAPAC